MVKVHCLLSSNCSLPSPQLCLACFTNKGVSAFLRSVASLLFILFATTAEGTAQRLNTQSVAQRAATRPFVCMCVFE